MGKCPSCGSSSVFGISTKQCIECGKIVCDRCVPNLIGTFRLKIGITPGLESVYETVGFCSNNCFYQFWGEIDYYPVAFEIGTDMLGFDDKVTYVWNKAISNTVANDFKAKAQRAVYFHSKNGVAFPWWDSENKHSWMYAKFYNRAKLALVRIWKSAEEHKMLLRSLKNCVCMTSQEN